MIFGQTSSGKRTLVIKDVQSHGFLARAPSRLTGVSRRKSSGFASQNSRVLRPLPKSPLPRRVSAAYLASSPVEMHPLLRYSLIPTLSYDLRCRPTTLWTCFDSMQPDIFDEPATIPALPKLQIVNPLLLWKIDVQPTQRTRSGGFYVSVLDVLMALYTSLKKQITREEFQSYYRCPDIQRRALQAYEERCRKCAFSCDGGEERRRGLRRVDFLGEQTRFVGLVQTHRSIGELVLCCGN